MGNVAPAGGEAVTRSLPEKRWTATASGFSRRFSPDVNAQVINEGNAWAAVVYIRTPLTYGASIQPSKGKVRHGYTSPEHAKRAATRMALKEMAK